MIPFLLAALVVQAPAPVATPSYVVSMTIAADGRTLGTPTITLRERQPGSVTVDGPNGYKAEVKVVGAVYRGTAGADVAAQISRKQAGEWVVVSQPRMTVTLAKPATMQFAREGEPPAFAFGVTVTRASDPSS